MTPSDIEVLIHCHVSPSVHPRAEAPAVTEALKKMIDTGLIEKDVVNFGFNTTDRGKAHIKQLCNLSLPIPVFTDEEGEIID